MRDRVGDGASLLLVVESEAVREALRDWLALVFPDLTVIEAASGEAAAALIQPRSPDAILVDISPYGLDGAKVVRALRSAGPSAGILALTMDEHEAGRSATLSAGADACVCIWDVRTELPAQLEELLVAEPQERGRRTAVAVRSRCH